MTSINHGFVPEWAWEAFQEMHDERLCHPKVGVEQYTAKELYAYSDAWKGAAWVTMKYVAANLVLGPEGSVWKETEDGYEYAPGEVERRLAFLMEGLYAPQHAKQVKRAMRKAGKIIRPIEAFPRVVVDGQRIPRAKQAPWS